MDQIIVTSHNASDLNTKIKNLIAQGWVPVGGHQVVQTHIQNRYAGSQHMDSIIEVEYSQTMRYDLKLDN